MKKSFAHLGLLLAVPILFGVGCSAMSVKTGYPITPNLVPTVEQASGKWEQMETGIDRLAYASSSLSATVIIYRLDPALFNFHFEASTGTRSLSEWSAGFPEASLIVNGAYFHEDNSPSGFLVSHGEVISDRRFDLDKSGIINLSGGVRLIDTATEPIKFENLKEAAQSFPFFIKQGQPAIKEDSQKPARRSFIGKDRQGRVLVGVVPLAQISLFQLMELLDEVEVEWEDALNLDGGPSTGIFVHTRKRSEELPSLFPVPNVIVVTKK